MDRLLDRDTLSERCAAGKTFTYLYFWGHTAPKDGTTGNTCVSQWYPASFEIDGISYATEEHWMMASKARLFADDVALQEIRAAPDPKSAKVLRRQVQNFDDNHWRQSARRLVTEGNVGKFSQNAAPSNSPSTQ